MMALTFRFKLLSQKCKQIQINAKISQYPSICSHTTNRLRKLLFQFLRC